MQFLWNEEKNELLNKERGINFSMIVDAIASGNLIDIVEHHNKEKYGNQKIYVVDINGYCYLVPFVKTSDNNVFLKTIYPSRKAVKQYKKEKLL